MDKGSNPYKSVILHNGANINKTTGPKLLLLRFGDLKTIILLNLLKIILPFRRCKVHVFRLYNLHL